MTPQKTQNEIQVIEEQIIQRIIMAQTRCLHFEETTCFLGGIISQK